jgi:hypothetical protein
VEQFTPITEIMERKGQVKMKKTLFTLAALSSMWLSSCDKLPEDFNLKFDPFYRKVVHEPKDVKPNLIPEVDVQVYMYLNGQPRNMRSLFADLKNGLVYEGPVWENGKNTVPHLEQLLSATDLISFNSRHPDSLDPVRGYVSDNVTNGKVTAKYIIDPENKVEESDETDNIAILEHSLRQIEYSLQMLEDQANIRMDENRRYIEEQSWIRHLESRGYEVTEKDN